MFLEKLRIQWMLLAHVKIPGSIHTIYFFTS
jgi:hypothetical protein